MLRRAIPLILLGALVALPGCGTLKGTPKTPATGIDVPVSTRAEEERGLEALVLKELEAAARYSSEGNSQLRHPRPYFYREYVVYPDGIEQFRAVYSETESRTTPLTAEASLRMVRYATELTKNKESARNDSDFQRDEGKQTLSFQYRNGKWRRVGSVFIAEKSERFSDGEWRLVRERAQIEAAPEVAPKTGLWRRALNRVRPGEQ